MNKYAKSIFFQKGQLIFYQWVVINIDIEVESKGEGKLIQQTQYNHKTQGR